MQNSNDKIIEKIKLLCDQNNISVNKLLQECDLSKSVIDNMKKGSIPSIDKIEKISKYFNVSEAYLKCETDDPTPPDKKNTLSPEKLKLLDGIGYAYFGRDGKELDDDDVDDILKVVEMTRKAREKRNKENG